MKISIHTRVLTISLAALMACTADKGDDSGESASEANTDSASSSETGAEPTEPQSTQIHGDTDEVETEGAETGDTDTGEVGGEPQCVDTPTVLAGDESSPLGFSGEELLLGKLGVRATTLKFAGEPTTLRDEIRGLELPLSVELRHEAGEIRWVDSEPNPNYDNQGNESGLQECTDRLEIDVKLDFVTAEGELDEHVDAVLVATEVETATLQVEVEQLAGSLDLTQIYKADADPQWQITRVYLGGTWKGELAGGSVMHEVLVGDDEDGFAGFGPLAFWGDEIPF